MVYNFTLTEELLFNLTKKDYISPLSQFNVPMTVILFLFEIVSPISLLLNLFVFVSCIIILWKKSSDRPALIFIAFNSVLDIFTTVTNAIVITGAVNPSLANVVVLPEAGELTHRCSVEKGT